MTTLIAHVERGLKPAQLHHSPAVERDTEFQEPQGPCKPVAAIGKEASTVRLTRLDCVNSQQAKTLSTAPTPNFQHSPFFGLQRVLPLNPQPCFSNIFLYWGIYTKRDARNCWRWSYLTTTIPAYPPGSSRKHGSRLFTLSISISFR